MIPGNQSSWLLHRLYPFVVFAATVSVTLMLLFYPWHTFLGIVVIPVIFFALRSLLAAVLLLLIASTVYYGFVLEYRMWLGSWPINILDLALLLCFVSFAINLRSARINNLSAFASALLFLVLVISLLGAWNGLANLNPTYELFKDFRLVLNLVAVIFLAAVSVRSVNDLRAIVNVGILSSLAIAVSQAAIMFSRISGQQDLSTIRDVKVFVHVIPLGIVLLNTLYWRRISTGWRSYFLLLQGLFILGILLSFTRGAWFILLLSVGLHVWRERKRRRGILVGFLAVMCGALAILAALPTIGALGYQLEFIELVQNRASTILFLGEDLSYSARKSEIEAAWGLVSQRPLVGWGFGTIIVRFDPITRTMWHSEFIHNSVLFYLVKIGFVGVSILVVLMGSLFRSVWHGCKSEGDGVAILRGLAVYCVSFALVGSFLGLLNHLASIVQLGVLLGLSNGVSRIVTSRGVEEVSRRQK